MKARILIVALATLVSFMGYGQDNTAPVVSVPQEGKLLMRVYGKGVQLYTCQASPKDSTKFIWVLQGVKADLYKNRSYEEVIGKHYFNEAHHPVWEWVNKDWGKVVGNKIQQADAPDPTAIPWLVLAAISTPDAGPFKTTATIRRIRTAGGKAQGTGADQAHIGQSVEVPYTAEYLFYSAN